MSFGKYLISRVFFMQILTAIAILCGLAFLFFHWITYITHHGEEIVVPNLSKMNIEQVQEKLYELNLDYQVIDTIDFRPQFPKLSVVQQEPTTGEKVKKGRIIYIKLNAETYKMVSVPDLLDKTYRQAVPTLKAAGFIEGEVSYVPYIGKDMVLEIRFNGKKINPGTKLLKSSKLDLVLGDGAVEFDESKIDNDTIRRLKELSDTLRNGQ